MSARPSGTAPPRIAARHALRDARRCPPTPRRFHRAECAGRAVRNGSARDISPCSVHRGAARYAGRRARPRHRHRCAPRRETRSARHRRSRSPRPCRSRTTALAASAPPSRYRRKPHRDRAPSAAPRRPGAEYRHIPAAAGSPSARTCWAPARHAPPGELTGDIADRRVEPEHVVHHDNADPPTRRRPGQIGVEIAPTVLGQRQRGRLDHGVLIHGHAAV